MYTLKVISSTVRPGRKGPIVAQWVVEKAQASGYFKVEFLDLGVVKLPLMDEKLHPSQQKYEHEHTKKWSAAIGEADAYIFVTAEYDHTYPAPLRNALEYLVHEWAYKAGGIVSYGGVSAGTRAANGLKLDLATKKIVPLFEMVNIPFFEKMITDGKLVSNEVMDKAIEVQFRELVKWTEGLKTIRAAK